MNKVCDACPKRMCEHRNELIDACWYKWGSKDGVMATGQEDFLNRMKTISDEISEFLEGMRNGGTVKTFTEGYCYWMAMILKERFGGEIMYNAVDNHFGTMIAGKIWDITGEIDYGEWVEWWLFQMNEPGQAKRITIDCIKKTSNEEEK